jgi:transposase
LFDLLSGVEEPPSKHTGRYRTPIRDRIMASCIKVFTTLSSRRFACDLKDAYEHGFLSKLMNSMSVCAYLESDLMTPILFKLIERSAMPLIGIEHDLIPDSTGFSTSRFVRWYNEKYGREQSGRVWVKAHAMVGAKTNIVTSLIVDEPNTADCPQLKPLLEASIANGFKVQTVPADKAYLSRENLELVARLGATAYIPFKSNSTAGEPGSLWERMYGLFMFRRDEFLKAYHVRSNVEATFSMVKAKFGDAVRSKTDVATKNEVLCKFLCHNIVVVHQAMLELGIDGEFWPDSGEDRDVIPFRVQQNRVK